MSDHRAYQLVLLRDPCSYCGGIPTGLDHIQPRSTYEPGPNSRKFRYWMNSWENRTPACMRCDNFKGDSPVLLFLIKIQRRGLPDVTRSQTKRMGGLFRAMRRGFRNSV